MNRFAKVVPVLSASVALVFGLTACGGTLPGTKGVASDESQRNAAVAELKARGFEDPVFVGDNTDVTPDEMRLTAKVGTCRIAVSRTAVGDFDYRDASWNKERLEQIRAKNGGSLSSVVNASFIIQNGVELGWAHCLKG
jgi:hypothetical protein